MSKMTEEKKELEKVVNKLGSKKDLSFKELNTFICAKLQLEKWVKMTSLGNLTIEIEIDSESIPKIRAILKNALRELDKIDIGKWVKMNCKHILVYSWFDDVYRCSKCGKELIKGD